MFRAKTASWDTVYEGADLAVKIGQMRPCTAYCFRLCVRNVVGVSLPGPQIHVETTQPGSLKRAVCTRGRCGTSKWVVCAMLLGCPCRVHKFKL